MLILIQQKTKNSDSHIDRLIQGFHLRINPNVLSRVHATMNEYVLNIKAHT